jgi:hypothetical protein
MEQRTAEVNAAVVRAHGALNRRDAKALIERAAADMDQYVARMNAEIPLVSRNASTGR